MNTDYFDFLKLINLLHAKTSILKNKYSELNVDEIKDYELSADINMINELVNSISFKKHKIVEQLFDELSHILHPSIIHFEDMMVW